jgi:Flp pilus assembly protein TadG
MKMPLTTKQQNRRKAERGSVTVMTAVLLGGLVLLLGMSIDVSRIYMVRSGLQNAADAAALAAARELNSGTAGLTEAVAQAQSVTLQENKYGLNRTGSTPPSVTISRVEFAPGLNGPWYNGAAAASAAATTIKFVRVTTQSTSTSMLFAARALGSSHVEERTAVAGMSVPLNNICNFFPVAVALTNPYPANHAQLTFQYSDGTGNSITVGDMRYLVLNVPDINGLGQPETANLAAGITNLCASIGSTIGLNNSPSANPINGPKSIADGANTRFDLYQNGYANSLNPTAYPPDTNVYDNTGSPLTTTQYLNKSPITAPPRNPPGQDDRRILIMPIIPPATYTGSPPLVPIVRFGAFLLRNSIDRTGNCNGNGPCAGAMKVEYLGDDFVIPNGEYDPNNPCVLLVNSCSSLTKSVMYQ